MFHICCGENIFVPEKTATKARLFFCCFVSSPVNQQREEQEIPGEVEKRREEASTVQKERQKEESERVQETEREFVRCKEGMVESKEKELEKIKHGQAEGAEGADE